MADVGHRVGQAIVQNLPVPPSHELLSQVVADPNFQVDTQGMSPQEYGQYLADITGEAILNFQKQSSDPNSPLSQAQNVDLASRLGSESAAMRLMQVPGVPSREPGQGAAGYYAPEGLSHGISSDFATAMGRPSLTQSDALVLSPLANDTTLRHELFHRGMRRLESQGLSIDRDDEEMVARIFDYKLGNNEDKARSVWFWKEYYDMTPEQVLSLIKFKMKRLMNWEACQFQDHLWNLRNVNKYDS
jgi:hypothetical protein